MGCAHPSLESKIITPTLPVDESKIIAHSKEFLVLRVEAGDSLRSLAIQFFGDASKDWVIAKFNQIEKVSGGQRIVIPYRNLNPYGIYLNGIQKVPILTYHSFLNKDQPCQSLSVKEDSFASQMAYLKKNNFSVIGFPEFADFLDGNGNLPPNSVILSFDDGFKSIYEIAFPILKKFGFKATIFIYSDLIGVPAGLTWKQMKEMVDSGLIDIQPHSKTHSDLSQRLDNEDDTSYRNRIHMEVNYPAQLIRNKLGLTPHIFAYPFGMESDVVMDIVRKAGYRLATTVTRGGNPSFSHPYVLRRSQIYCEDTLKAFATRLEVFERVSLK